MPEGSASFKVLIRADGGSSLGFGHLMRCLSLATGLRDRGGQILFAGAFDEAARSLLDSRDVGSRSFEPGFERENDARRTSRVIDDLGGVDLLVVDHYRIDRDWFHQLAHRPFTICIDDLHDRDFLCEVLLDQNWVFDDNPYASRVPSGCQFLLGPKYSLLRQEFSVERAKVAPRFGVIRKVLVSFGASDPTGETRKVLEGFLNAHVDGIQLKVLPGPSNPVVQELEREFGSIPGIEFLAPPADMARLLTEIDLAVGAGGSSVWERCCLGVPSMIVQTAVNQASIVRAGIEKGFAACLGEAHQVSSESWKAFFLGGIHDEERWKTQSRIGQRLVDGSGVDRVAQTLIKLMSSEPRGRR